MYYTRVHNDQSEAEKPPFREARIFEEHHFAERFAFRRRQQGYSARIYQRDVRADNRCIITYVVVVRARAQEPS